MKLRLISFDIRSIDTTLKSSFRLFAFLFIMFLWVPLSRHIGALAITVANPTDLVKVRLQAEGKLPPGVPRRYSGALNAYSTIVRQVDV